MKYANGTQFTRTEQSSKFYYHEEDTHCIDCLYWRGRSKSHKVGCELESCCCADIRAEAMSAGRIKRPKGWWSKQCRDM